MTWVCKMCGQNNVDSATECELCGTPADPGVSVAAVPPATSAESVPSVARKPAAYPFGTSGASKRRAAGRRRSFYKMSAGFSVKDLFSGKKAVLTSAWLIILAAFVITVITGVCVRLYAYEWGLVTVVFFNAVLGALIPVFCYNRSIMSAFAYFALADFAVTSVMAFCFEEAYVPAVVNFALLTALCVTAAVFLFPYESDNVAVGAALLAVLSLAATIFYSVHIAIGLNTDAVHAASGFIIAACVAMAVYYASKAVLGVRLKGKDYLVSMIETCVLTFAFAGLILNIASNYFYETVSATFYCAAALTAGALGVYKFFGKSKDDINVVTGNVCFALALVCVMVAYYVRNDVFESDSLFGEYMIVNVFALYAVFVADRFLSVCFGSRYALAMTLISGAMLASLAATEICFDSERQYLMMVLLPQCLAVLIVFVLGYKSGTTKSNKVINALYCTFILGCFVGLILTKDVPENNEITVSLAQSMAGAFFVYYVSRLVAVITHSDIRAGTSMLTAVTVTAAFFVVCIVFDAFLGTVFTLAAMAVVLFANVFVALAKGEKTVSFLSLLLAIVSAGLSLMASL